MEYETQGYNERRELIKNFSFRKTSAARTDQAPKLDGTLDDAVWADAPEFGELNGPVRLFGGTGRRGTGLCPFGHDYSWYGISSVNSLSFSLILNIAGGILRVPPSVTCAVEPRVMPCLST